MITVLPFHTWVFLSLPFIAETELGYTACSSTEQTEEFSLADNLIVYFIKAKLLFLIGFVGQDFLLL